MDRYLQTQQSFYKSRAGRIIRRTLKQDIATLWNDCHNLNVLGAGYAVPYMDIFADQKSTTQTSICYANIPPDHYHHFARAARTALPLSPTSIDRVLMIYDLEFCHDIPAYLNELNRVLMPDGKILLIVPSRKSKWSHTDWSPFGYGAPFSYRHLIGYINQSPFTITHQSRALYMPPSQNPLILKTAGAFEYIGRHLRLYGGGVHVIELSKHTFGGTPVRSAPKKAPTTSFAPTKPIPSAYTQRIC